MATPPTSISRLGQINKAGADDALFLKQFGGHTPGTGSMALPSAMLEVALTVDDLRPGIRRSVRRSGKITATFVVRKPICEQHPHLDIRFVLLNPNTMIGKKSETTYGLWCERLCIHYATRWIPQAWIDEPPPRARIKAVQDGLG